MDKETQKVMFSSVSVEWATPKDFYERLNSKYNFNLDPCSTKENAKCLEHYTLEDDGLSKSWEGKKVFMNPPYGRAIKDWIKKAYEEGQKPGTLVACLIPARTDTRYWHDYCMKASEIFLVKGRIHFESGDTKAPAPFPSAVVVFRGPPIKGMTRPSVKFSTMEAR